MKTKEETKMVCVRGVWIRADKAEGRINAMKKEDTLKEVLAEDDAKKRQQLKDEDYSAVEIANIMRSTAHQEALDMGLGTFPRGYKMPRVEEETPHANGKIRLRTDGIPELGIRPHSFSYVTEK